MGGNEVRARGCGTWNDGPRLQLLLRWSRRNLRDRLIWSLAVFVSAVKATTFTVPKVVILGDVILTD